ncbi:MAG: hypothetical protein KAS36_07290 [Anaerolineales bacterium]|nr:hypothetical protein [Anaerolineales bacterium]
MNNKYSIGDKITGIVFFVVAFIPLIVMFIWQTIAVDIFKVKFTCEGLACPVVYWFYTAIVTYGVIFYLTLK